MKHRTGQFVFRAIIGLVLAVGISSVPQTANAIYELQVNDYNAGQQWEPAIATASDGSFVVVWASDGQDGDGYGIFGRVFRPNGLSAGPEFQINEQSAGMQRSPSVGIDAEGRFVVVWVEENGGTWKVKARRYSSFGAPCQVGTTPLSPEIEVAERSPTAAPFWRLPGLGVAPDGKFSVAWVDPYLGSDDRLFFKHFNSDNVPTELTSAIEVPRYNTVGYGIMHDPKVAATSWGVFLSWLDDGATYSQWLGDLVARRYDWSGVSKDGSTSLIDTWVEQGGAALAVTPDETILVAYRRREQFPVADNNVYLAHFDESGSLFSENVQVNTGNYNWGQRTYNTGVGVAASHADDSGSWDAVVIWNLREYGDSGYEDNILARHYSDGDIPAPSSDDEVKINLLTGMAQVLWSQSALAMVSKGVFRAVWWGGPAPALEVYLQCGKFSETGGFDSEFCEHDRDFDGVPNRFDVHPFLPSVGYDVDRDQVPDHFMCGATASDCINECNRLYSGNAANIGICAQRFCKEDNCLGGTVQVCADVKNCLRKNNSYSCFRMAHTTCEDLYSNTAQKDSNLNGHGDKCEHLDDVYYFGEAVDLLENPPPLKGPGNKILISNLRVDPDPLMSSDQHASLLFDLNAEVLPGLMSGKFAFELRVEWHIKTNDTVRLIAQDFDVNQIGTQPIEIQWDGKDSSGLAAATGTYIHQVTAVLVRTKPKTGTAKEFDRIVSQWRTMQKGNGTKIRCFPARCDLDGDGYAASYTDYVNPEMSCNSTELEATTAGRLCPDGWLMYGEAVECDRYTIDWNDLSGTYQTILDQRMTQGLSLGEKLAQLSDWSSRLADIHPNKYEPSTPGNHLDDNCNRRINETHFIYTEWGRDVTHDSFTVQVRITHPYIKHWNYVDEIRFHVFRLSDITADIWGDGKINAGGLREFAALSSGRLEYNQRVTFFHDPEDPNSDSYTYNFPVTIGPTVTEVSVPNHYHSLFDVEVTGLPTEGGVFVVGITYHKNDNQVFCVDANSSSPVYDYESCLGYPNSYNRFLSDVYLVATDKMVNNQIVSHYRMRRLVVNKALYEWHLSNMGLVGGQHAQNPLYPDGTRYRADYDERWCTEFCSYTYNESMQGSPFSNLLGWYFYTDQMENYFGNNGGINYYEDARLNTSGFGSAPNPARYGDWTLTNTKDEWGKKNHSSIFIGTLKPYSSVDTVQFLTIDGNSSRRVQMKAIYPWAENSVGDYIVKGLGHLDNEQPGQ